MLIAKPPQNPNKAIAYIRVSSQRQVDEGVSIDAQEDRIREYARFKGLDLDDADILILVKLEVIRSCSRLKLQQAR